MGDWFIEGLLLSVKTHLWEAQRPLTGSRKPEYVEAELVSAPLSLSSVAKGLDKFIPLLWDIGWRLISVGRRKSFQDFILCHSSPTHPTPASSGTDLFVANAVPLLLLPLSSLACLLLHFLLTNRLSESSRLWKEAKR